MESARRNGKCLSRAPRPRRFTCLHLTAPTGEAKARNYRFLFNPRPVCSRRAARRHLCLVSSGSRPLSPSAVGSEVCVSFSVPPVKPVPSLRVESSRVTDTGGKHLFIDWPQLLQYKLYSLHILLQLFMFFFFFFVQLPLQRVQYTLKTSN